MQLYEQTMDAQEGVVYFLLEEMAQQRIKENLLAYTLLLSRGLPPRSLPPQAPLRTIPSQYCQVRCTLFESLNPQDKGLRRLALAQGRR